MSNPEIERWLNRYHNANTRLQMKVRIAKFLEAVNVSEDNFVNMKPEDAEDLILNYQRKEEDKGTPNNTILGTICAPRALFSALRKPLLLKGQLVELEEAKNKHIFSNGDLGKLYDAGDTRAKAIICLGSSLGWGISDVLALDKEVIKTEIERAKDSGEKFIFIKRQRGKTHAKALGIINPMAIDALSKWLPINKKNSLFDISADQINKELQRLAVEAQLKTTGRVSFHGFRAWVLSSLIKAGFSEFEAKLIVGKSIPLSDVTYLSLEESIKKKYQEQYEHYLSIKPVFSDTKKQKELEEQLQHTTTELESLKKTVTDLKNNETKWRTNQFNTKYALDVLLKKLREKGIDINLDDMLREHDEECEYHSKEKEES